MAKITVDLDLTVIQEAIQQECLPDVARIINQHYDIKALIQEQLVRDTPPPKPDPSLRYFGIPMSWEPSAYGELTGKKLLDGLVRNAIRRAAENYVNDAIINSGDALERAFKRMMQDSPERLVRHFVKMIEGADLSLRIANAIAIEEDDDDDDDIEEDNDD